jgi:hypothetical protein
LINGELIAGGSTIHIVSGGSVNGGGGGGHQEVPSPVPSCCWAPLLPVLA